MALRRSTRSTWTAGGRLVVVLAAGPPGRNLAAWWLQPAGPLRTLVVRDGLENPWDLAFTDDGRMIVTERIG